MLTRTISGMGASSSLPKFRHVYSNCLLLDSPSLVETWLSVRPIIQAEDSRIFQSEITVVRGPRASSEG